jgi:dTDP-4-amino-4,6-dideoxygalactose transaminase
MVNFVENKKLDFARISEKLQLSAEQNRWANRGPVYNELALAFESHMNIMDNATIVPCSNGGIALEAMARLHEQRMGRKLKWLVSAFSFQNLGRGYFSEVIFVDCDETGLLSKQELVRVNQDDFDGIILVNPFGMAQDFTSYIEFAKKSKKALLIDNAAGISSLIPKWPWQSFSLHHTKPYGIGEGGLALVPSELADEFYALLDYGIVPNPASTWLNNGKISDISCAFHLNRLETASEWIPLYLEQEERVIKLASRFGLKPLLQNKNRTAKTSCAFLHHKAVQVPDVDEMTYLHFGKYYKPLRPLPNAKTLYENLVNIPTHPDLSQLTDAEIGQDIEKTLS